MLKRFKYTLGMKKLILLSLITIPAVSLAYRAPEVLHLDEQTPDVFLISNSKQDALIELKNGDKKIQGELTCDSAISFKKKGLFRKKHLGNTLTFTLNKNKRADITISKDTESCLLTFNDRKVRLIKDEVAYPFLKSFNHRKENCRFVTDSQSGLDQLFLTNNYPMMTCAHPAYDVQILERSEDGLLAKMETLLGYNPGLEFIKAQNPYAELDFSRAPRLKAIFISTLLYRRDFTGTVIGRILKYHAERGTLVNIIGTGYMQDEKDKALLKELSQVKNGNIRIQEYKYIDPDSGLKSPGKYLTNYLRDFHVKMFVTLSDDAENNTIITGGRNIHDGFVFADKPDFSAYPEIQQSPKGAYAYWNDLEIKITSRELAESAYAHLLKFWNRQVKGQVTEDISFAGEDISGDVILSSSQPMMRHILSLPFNDDHVLEKLFVEMIDRSEKSIRLASPYLRPTKQIMDAFKRAIERGVEISIQTRINLAGDTQAWLYEETNKAAINDLYSKVKIYEWTENSILHTKMMIIDEKLTFFGSVNLSRRSFIQDVESGYLINDVNLTSRLVDVFEGYKQKSRVIDQKQKRKFWASIFINILENQF